MLHVVLSAHQQPLRLLRLGSEAPGCLGRGMIWRTFHAWEKVELERAPVARYEVLITTRMANSDDHAVTYPK